MALAANTPRIYEVDSIYDQLPVKATEVIWTGAAVGMVAGYARGLVAGTTDKFAGFAEETVTGTSASGGVSVTVRKRGVVKLPVTDLAVTNWGAAVYASDDGTFTLDADDGGGPAIANVQIGKVVRFISTGIGMVAFDTEKTTL
jgi:hypothetical protein